MLSQKIKEAYKKNHIAIGTFQLVIAVSAIVVLLVCSIQSLFNLLEGSVLFGYLILVLNADYLMKVELDVVDIKEYLSCIINRIAISDECKVLWTISVIVLSCNFIRHDKTVWVMVQGLIQTLLVRLSLSYYMCIQQKSQPYSNWSCSTNHNNYWYYPQCMLDYIFE